MTETTWGGSLKERWGMAYTVVARNLYSYYFLCTYVDIRHIKNLVAMETWGRCPDHDTYIKVTLWLQGLKLIRPRYSFKILCYLWQCTDVFSNVSNFLWKSPIQIDCFPWRTQLTKKYQCHATTTFISTIYAITCQHFIKLRSL